MLKGKKHAVLTDTQICFMEDGKVRKVETEHLETLDSLLHLCSLLAIDTLWVQPQSTYARWGADDLVDCTWDIKAGTIKLPGAEMEILRTISARRGRTWITVTWPEFSYEWHTHAFKDLLEPNAMLACLHYLEQAFEISVHHNPGVMGRSLMEKDNATARRKEWMKPPTFDLDKMFLGDDYTRVKIDGENYTYKTEIEDTEGYLAIWRQQHNAAPGAKIWLHSWDIESQYPSAASVALLPCGTAQYGYECDNPGWLSSIGGYMNKRPNGKSWDVAPGFYQLTLYDNPGKHSPFFVEMNPLEDGQWVTSPMLTLLLNEGVGFSIDAAWIYPEKHAVLSEFGPTFWRARQAIKSDAGKYRHPVGRELAYYSAKRIGAASIGLLNSPLTKKFNPEMYRPDWWRFIVEEGKAREYFNLKKVWAKYKEYPIMVATDQPFYLSLESDPAKVFPECFTRAGELGGWKYSFSNGPIEVTPEVLDCFNPEFSPGKSIVELRRFQ